MFMGPVLREPLWLPETGAENDLNEARWSIIETVRVPA